MRGARRRARGLLSRRHRGGCFGGAAASLLHARRDSSTGSGASCAIWCYSPNITCSRTRRFRALDLISCRNLLIYLDRELQQQVIAAPSTTRSLRGGLPVPRLLRERRQPAGPVPRRSIATHTSTSRSHRPGDGLPVLSRLLTLSPSVQKRALQRSRSRVLRRARPRLHRLALEKSGAAEHPGR